MPGFVVRGRLRQLDGLSDVAIRRRHAATGRVAPAIDGCGQLPLGATVSLARDSRAGFAAGGERPGPARVSAVAGAGIQPADESRDKMEGTHCDTEIVDEASNPSKRPCVSLPARVDKYV